MEQGNTNTNDKVSLISQLTYSTGKEERLRILMSLFSSAKHFSHQLSFGDNVSMVAIADNFFSSILERIEFSIKAIISDIAIDTSTDPSIIKRMKVVFKMLARDINKLKETYQESWQSLLDQQNKLQEDPLSYYTISVSLLKTIPDPRIHTAEENLEEYRRLEVPKLDIELKQELLERIGEAIEDAQYRLDEMLELYTEQGIGETSPGHLVWKKTDTDLLELLTGMYVSQSITNLDGNLSKKEAIRILSEFFQQDVKDAEGKISHLIKRKRSNTAYLDSLVAAVKSYGERHEEN